MLKLLTVLPALLLVTATTCGTETTPVEPELQWMEHPCGNLDPLPVDCEDHADHNWESASTDLCVDLGVTDGDGCSTQGVQCVLLQAYTCASQDDQFRSSEAFLTCRDKPFEEGPCPQ